MGRTELARLVVLLLAGVGWLWPQSLPATPPTACPTASTTTAPRAPGKQTVTTLPAAMSRCGTSRRAPSPLRAVLDSRRLFSFSQAALSSAASFDLTLTASGLRHPPILHLTIINNGLTRFVNLDERDRFAEGGWARVLGAHNTPAILAAYIGEDLAILLLVRSFVHRHPRWRALGTLALLSQTWVHIASGRTWIGLGPRLAAPYRQFNPVWVR